MLAIIHENRNVLFLKSMNIHNVVLHVEDVIVATAQFTRIVTDVVDSDLNVAKARKEIREQMLLAEFDPA